MELDIHNLNIKSIEIDSWIPWTKIEVFIKYIIDIHNQLDNSCELKTSFNGIKLYLLKNIKYEEKQLVDFYLKEIKQ